jgi:hypothetical protein
VLACVDDLIEYDAVLLQRMSPVMADSVEKVSKMKLWN